MEQILTRRSVRAYKDIKIDDAILKELCYAGFSAPTARRQKSMKFVIVNDKEKLNALANVSKNSGLITNAAAVIAVIGAAPETITTPGMQIQDLSAATENILIAARIHQIGSCWIGITPVSERMEAAGKILKVKDNDFVFSLIALGYPSEENAFYDMHKEEDDKIYYNEVK